MNSPSLRSPRAAFSLIELLVSLCIIGVLATIAIPRFLSFRARSMQVEARASLTAIHQSLTTYVAEHNSYTDDLSLLAWRPTGYPRYLCGFVSDALPVASGMNDSAELAAAIPGSEFATTNMVGVGQVPLTEADLPDVATAESGHYTIACVANLDDDASQDLWQGSDTGGMTCVRSDAE